MILFAWNQGLKDVKLISVYQANQAVNAVTNGTSCDYSITGLLGGNALVHYIGRFPIGSKHYID